jgi:hypothetical protein
LGINDIVDCAIHAHVGLSSSIIIHYQARCTRLAVACAVISRGIAIYDLRVSLVNARRQRRKGDDNGRRRWYLITHIMTGLSPWGLTFHA